jgi:glycosyltransferase EpsD
VAFNIVHEVSPELINLGCKIHNIQFQRSPLKKDNYIAYRKIKELILKEGYELVHVHTPVASFLTRLACRNIPNLKVIYTSHGLRFYEGAPLKNWLLYYPLEKLAARWTDGIITINEEDYNSARKLKLAKSNSIHRVHGVGVDLTKFQPKTMDMKAKLRKKYNYSENEFILFYAAELNRNKHQDLLINVVNLLKSKIKNIRLLLAGNGNLKEQYEEQVKKLGLQYYVQFLGYRRDIPELLKISDVAVASSRREGLPVNVMEAMATGLPLVVTNCRGQRELICDGENGFIVGIDDTEGFANAVEELYKSRETRRKFGKRSNEFSKSYSLDKVMQEMEEVYSTYLDF